MPFSTVWEPQGVCTHFTGFVTAAEYVRSAEAICADPRFDALRFVIKDLLAIEGHAIDPHALEPIAAIRYGARLTNPNIYLVLLTSDPRLLPLATPTRSRSCAASTRPGRSPTPPPPVAGLQRSRPWRARATPCVPEHCRRTRRHAA